MKLGVVGILAALLSVGLPAGPARAEPATAAPKLVLTRADAARVLQEARRPGASVTLVNVWATWCLPCRQEFPELMRVYRELEPQGMRLVLVSADFEDNREETVRKFLQARGVDFPSFLKEEPDAEFIDGIDPRWSGALPASFWFDGNGVLQEMWEGDLTYKQILKKTKSVLGSSARRKEDK